MPPFKRARVVSEAFSPMNTALRYISRSRLAPSGELLTPSEKFMLMLLAGEADPEGVIRITADELAEYALVNRRSVFRTLAFLESKGAIKTVAQADAQGMTLPNAYLILDDQGSALPGETQARMLPVTSSPPLVTPSPRSVTPSPSATNSNNSNGYASGGSGTQLAPPPPLSLVSKGGGSVTDNTPGDKAVAAWLEIIGAPYTIELTPEGANLIRESVSNLEAWRFTLKGWLASGWNRKNIAGQVDRYATKVLPLPQFQAPPPPKAPPTAESQAETLRHKRLVYGDQS